MSEELLTDKDAANIIEEIQPSLAQVIQRLIKKGESPARIKIVARSVADGVISGLVERAAHFYKEQNDGI